MTLRLLVLLAVAAVVAHRFWPRQRLTWALPVLLGVTVLAVRGVAYVVAEEGAG